MELIEVLTSQHVTIAYKPANVVERVAASVADFVLQAFYAVALFFIFFNFDTMAIKSEDEETGLVIFLILLIPVLVYHFVFESFMGGQTPGKILLKIKVTSLDGSAASLGSYFLRWLIRPIDMMFNGGLAILFIILSKNHQRIGDMAAGTIVVKISSENPTINQELYAIGTSYQPQYTQVEKLSEGQIKLITDILELPQPEDEFDQDDSISRLTAKVKSFLGIIAVIGDERKFLETIVKDYTYYSSLGI